LGFPYQRFDALRSLRHAVRRELLAEAQKPDAWKLLREIPFIGPIRAALLIAWMQTPHRFRTKRQLWTYSGFGIETHSSAEQRFVPGELLRAKKPASIRGLNRNHNHELKNVFKSAATVAAAKAGPFKEFYDALVAKGSGRKWRA
jgi:transposase